MRILMVPMAAMAETSGPFSRTQWFAQAFIDRGYEVALCAARDPNFREISGTKNYFLPIPTPMGLPRFIGLHTFPIAEKLGLIKRKNVHSFEEVLFLTGANSYSYFTNSIEWIRKAIKDFKPDLVYAEFNLSAIIAAKLEGIMVFSSFSYPAQTSYATSPQYSQGVNRALKKLGINTVQSSLEIFEFADQLVIPSSYELEPINRKNVIFIGSLGKRKKVEETKNKDTILAYMGNGTISKSVLVKVLTEAFSGSNFEVYIAGRGLQEVNESNIHIGSHFDFSILLNSAVAFINHGGQNSMMDGLVYAVPQIICPGKVFERKYNAEIIEKNQAGIQLTEKNFDAENIKKAITLFTGNQTYSENAKKLGDSLAALGGAATVINQIECMFSGVI